VIGDGSCYMIFDVIGVVVLFGPLYGLAVFFVMCLGWPLVICLVM
jgi:hypothetical protein